MLDTLFVLTVIGVLPLWLLMIFLPRNPITRRLTNNYVFFILLGVFYLFTTVGTFLEALRAGQINFSSTAAWAATLSSPAMALWAWVHIASVDLAAGYLIYQEAQQMNMPRIPAGFFLVVTAALAPLGVFLFGMWKLLANMRQTAVQAVSRGAAKGQNG